MENNSIINIDSIQSLEGETDTISISARARYIKKDGIHYVWYDEIDRDTDETTATYLKFDDEKLYMRKRGQSSYEMTFDIAKKTITAMKSPYGVIDIEVLTDLVECTEYDKKIEVVLEYSLFTAGQALSVNKMEIEILFD